MIKKLQDTTYNNYLINNNELNKCPLFKTDEKDFENKYNGTYDRITKGKKMEYTVPKDRHTNMDTHSLDFDRDENEEKKLEDKVKMYSDKTNINVEEMPKLQNLQSCDIPNQLQHKEPALKGETIQNIMQDEDIFEIQTPAKKTPETEKQRKHNINIEIKTTGKLLQTGNKNRYLIADPSNDIPPYEI